MKKSLTYVLVGVVIVISSVILWQYSPKSNANIPNDQVKEVQLVLTRYSARGAEYVVFNNTESSIGVWPDTCASETITLQKKDISGKWEDYQKPKYVCTLAPAPIKYTAGESKSLKKTLNNVIFTPGEYRYVLRFGSYQESNRFMLENQSEVYSLTFRM
jgi:hypothetical protein